MIFHRIIVENDLTLYMHITNKIVFIQSELRQMKEKEGMLIYNLFFSQIPVQNTFFAESRSTLGKHI